MPQFVSHKGLPTSATAACTYGSARASGRAGTVTGTGTGTGTVSGLSDASDSESDSLRTAALLTFTVTICCYDPRASPGLRDKP